MGEEILDGIVRMFLSLATDNGTASWKRILISFAILFAVLLLIFYLFGGFS